MTRTVQRTGWLSPALRRELTGWRRIVTGRSYFRTTAAEKEERR